VKNLDQLAVYCGSASGSDPAFADAARATAEAMVREKVQLVYGGGRLGLMGLIADSVLERGGVTPWLSPGEFKALGYSMILYPTTLLFRLVRAIERGLDDLCAGRPLDEADSIDFARFEDLVDLEKWGAIEDRYTPKQG